MHTNQSRFGIDEGCQSSEKESRMALPKCGDVQMFKGKAKGDADDTLKNHVVQAAEHEAIMFALAAQNAALKNAQKCPGICVTVVSAPTPSIVDHSLSKSQFGTPFAMHVVATAAWSLTITCSKQTIPKGNFSKAMFGK